MSLSIQATKLIQAYCLQLQKSAAVEGVDVEKKFAIAPPVETVLRNAIIQSDSFLKMISNIPVDQIKGQVVDVGTGMLVTGRNANGRHMAKMGNGGHEYELVETDSGAAITWQMLTQWANAGSAKEFNKKMNQQITRMFALDILKIGFNGTSIAATTNPETNPLGQDVNKGWLTFVKERKPAQVLAIAKLDPTGATADSFRNLDALANDLKRQVIHEVHRESPDLVVLVGSDLVSYEQHRLLDQDNTPTEHKAAQSLSKTIAGMKAYTPPFFPADRMMITTPDNLQVLTQKGTQWRKAKNEEDRKQFENSYLRMEGYAVGDLDKYAAIEAVTIIDPPPAA
ncbi:phage major capsid protein, P2 family [Vibrio amylolyticus]|uniref:phage major capsid protein, P2 family n=1 Tax=Vibrio amylolyticus TaxID=2847292 RepID=UPI00354B6207